jgi:lipoprotein signal peptidase
MRRLTVLPFADRRRMMRSVVAFGAVTAAAAAADLVTKSAAVAHLTDHRVPLSDWLDLALVYNTAAAGGMWWGSHTWLLNVVLTALAVVLVAVVVPILARFDTRAPLRFGLIAGGGMGNMVSLGTSDAGVPDFIAVWYGRGAIVVNVADLALLAGLLMLLPLLWRLCAASITHAPDGGEVAPVA